MPPRRIIDTAVLAAALFAFSPAISHADQTDVAPSTQSTTPATASPATPPPAPADAANQATPPAPAPVSPQATDTTATGLPVPTDLPPPEVPAPHSMHFGDRTIVGGSVDLRYRTASHGRSNTTYMNDAEVDVTYPIVRHGVTRGNVVLQAIGEDPQDIHDGADIQFGEAYIIYQVPTAPDADSTAFIKVGQFQVPFGLLAVYDPHLQLTQPLYSESLGIRNDWGVAISGRFYSILNYDLSITRGVGPSVIGQVDPTEVVNFRLGRTFVTRNGTVNFGGSMLAGRLPDNAIDAKHPFAILLPPSGRVRADQGYINKSRIAADATLIYKRSTARGEAIVGADNDNRVLGYYLAGEYMATSKFGGIIAHSYWRYPLGDSFSDADQLGVTYAMSPNVTWRGLYESLHDRPKDLQTSASHRFTVQLLFRF